MTSRPLSLLCAALAGTSLALGAAGGLVAGRIPPAAAAPSRAAKTIEIVADIVLIESQCRQVDVVYRRLFDFAQRNGIAPEDLMPLGKRHAAFDEAYRRRARETGRDSLCTSLLAAREADVPGVFAPR